VALTCARCGVQNPDGNKFCQACGTPLTAVAAASAATAAPPQPPPPAWAPAPPPPPQAPQQAPPAASWSVVPQQPAPDAAWAPSGMAPPTAGASGYQSPYYAPQGVPMPVHRTPWTMIIAGVVVLILVMVGFGTALAVVRNQNSSDTTSSLSSPSPESTPENSGPSVSNAGETVPLLAGWTVLSKDNQQITVGDPGHTGVVTVASGPINPAQSAEQDMAQVNDGLKSKYPDAKVCPGTNISNSTFNGERGIYYTLCLTVSSGGRSIPTVASMFVGANTDGSVVYLVMSITLEGNLQAFLVTARPVLQGIQWKLF
jgi:zinc ribbon protein